jgi:membrane-associated protease RseP (regulator of RpoE activity)
MNSSFDPATGFFVEVRPRSFPWVNVILFLVTCLSTLLVGAALMMNFNGVSFDNVAGTLWEQPLSILAGAPFCIAIMSILFAHEMGHYLTCRYYGIDATLPYFIPFPNPVGTMGAFIKIKSPIYDRGSLLEVGVAGPIAGFIVAFFALLLSITHGRFVPLASIEGGISIGEPLIYKAIVYVMGMTPPPGMDLYMHPVTFAAWFGFLATALNLLPAAQLDGGHITYALFRRYHRWISWGVVIVLAPLGVFYWVGWFVWIALLLFLKLRHPPTIDDYIPLRRRQIVLGIIGYVLLILCFMPAPFII